MNETEMQKTLDEALSKLGRLVMEGKPIPVGSFTEEDFATLYTIGFGLYESGDYKRAKTVFHHLITAKPLNSEYWFCMGSCLQMEKQFDEALSAWAMCALLDGHNPLPHFHAGECYYSLENPSEGKKAMSLFLQLTHENPAFAEERERANLLLNQWRVQ